ncbi:MAG: hypothetical protein HPY45_01865 [Anaerolineae bacterium]|nr:hypothetical protein [Anaerolineae bacterium]
MTVRYKPFRRRQIAMSGVLESSSDDRRNQPPLIHRRLRIIRMRHLPPLE